MRDHDWSATPLGAADSWPESLRAIVDLMLAASQLATLAIGSERIFLYNDEAARHYGDRHPDALGRPLADAFPHEFDKVAPYYDRVFAGESLHVSAQPLDPAETGTPELFDAYLAPVRDGAGDVIAAYMTGFASGERLRAEERLRESEARQAFLLRLSDTLRPLRDTMQIQRAAMALLGEQLAVNRAAYYQVAADGITFSVTASWERGAPPPLPERMRITDYGEDHAQAYRAGRTEVGRDTEQDIASDDIQAAVRPLQVRAWIGVPLLKEGRWFASIGVHSLASRDWTPAEIRLVEDVAERTWDAVERARAEAALSEGEERQAFLLQLSDAVRPLANPADIQGETTRLLREQLNAGWCYYVDWDLDKKTGLVLRDSAGEGLPSLTGAHDVSGAPEFLQLQADGAVLTISNYADYEQLSARIRQNFTAMGFRSMMAAPLVKGGRLIASLLVGDTKIRDWTASEASLLVEVAERTWAAIEWARAEAALRASEERLRALATAGGNTIYRMSPDWRLMYQLDSTTLATTSEPIADWVDKYIPGEDLPRVRAAIGEAIRTKTLFELEHRVRQADGSIGWVLSRAVPMLGPDGEIVEWFGAGSDVTERRLAVEGLRASDERLRQFGEASQDVLWIRDAETLQWVYLTPAFETIYGVSRDEALSGDNYRSWLDLIVPDDRERAAASIARVRAGEHVTFEYRIRRPSDGAIRWLRNTDFPIGHEDGEARLIGGVGHDITTLKRIEEALAAAEDRQRALVEGIPQLVWRAVDGGEWTWASPQWTDYSGQSEAESHGWGWIECVHPDDRDAARQAWANAIERGGFEVDCRIGAAREGGWRWFQTRATPVRDDHGAIVEWLGTSTDVNELRTLQERQLVLVAELQHRVRNILTVVRSVFGRTVETGGDPEEIADHFRGRLDSLARTQVIVTQNASGLVDLEDMIRDELLSVGAGDGPRLTIEGPEVALPPKAAESIGLGIHELTTNALKYGALKIPNASLDICWSIDLGYGGNRRLDLKWTEQGVPAIPLEPVRRGFGTELITEALPYRLGAETSLQFRGGGVRCAISVPLPEEGALAAPEWRER